MAEVQELNAVELILELHKKDGTAPLSKLPGLWYRKLDDRWEFWLNGHEEDLAPEPGFGTKISLGECYVKFNGWPAGIFSIISGEGCIAAGELANYHTFCDALKAALE